MGSRYGRGKGWGGIKREKDGKEGWGRGEGEGNALIIIIIIIIMGGQDREPQFLFQRISVAIQRFNAVLLHDGFFVFRPPGLVLL